MLRLRPQAVEEFHLRCPLIGIGARILTQLYQGIGLLGTGRKDPAGPVILEAARDQVNAVRQEGRGQGVARMPLVAAAVEGEAEALRAVEQTTFWQAETLGHGSQRPCRGAVLFECESRPGSLRGNAGKAVRVAPVPWDRRSGSRRSRCLAQH